MQIILAMEATIRSQSYLKTLLAEAKREQERETELERPRAELAKLQDYLLSD